MPSATLAQLESLLDHLKTEQHALIDGAARQGGPLHRSELHSVAELENVIAAVLALIEERRSEKPAS